MVDILRILAVNFAFVAAALICLWAVSQRLRDVTLIDSWWGLGMVALGVITLVQAGVGERQLLLAGLCAIWGLRLSGHLFLRWRGHGPDDRYVRMLTQAREERGWSFAKASFLLVFATQAPFQFIVALPVQLGQLGPEQPLGALAWTGAALAIVGVLFESIGDHQLTIFRKNPANRGKVLDTGLWRYTRHPNYFGDACVWWGLFLIAAEAPYGLWALPGPVLLTWTLVKWSGAALLEGRLRETRPDYVRYIETTSGFIPWPPKRA